MYESLAAVIAVSILISGVITIICSIIYYRRPLEDFLILFLSITAILLSCAGIVVALAKLFPSIIA